MLFFFYIYNIDIANAKKVCYNYVNVFLLLKLFMSKAWRRIYFNAVNPRLAPYVNFMNADFTAILNTKIF